MTTLREREIMFWGGSFAAGGFLGLVFIAAVFIGGQTFGQRCTALVGNDASRWEKCVSALARGEPAEKARTE
jgi:hypothetical protein